MPSNKTARLMVSSMPILFWLFCSVVFFGPISATAQTLEETQQQFLQGHYEEVIKTAKKQVEEGSSSDWRTLLIQSQLTLGRYGEAYTNAQNGVADYPVRLRMFLLARETSLFQNDLAGANRRLSQAQDFIEQPRSRNASGEELVALGEAMLLLGVEPQLVLEN